MRRFTWTAEALETFLVAWSAAAAPPRDTLDEACATRDGDIVRATLARVAPRTVSTLAAAAIEDGTSWCTFP